MNEEEFFNKFIMENPSSFKNGIIAHCRELDKAEVYEWVANDELKIRKLIQENQQLKEEIERLKKELYSATMTEEEMLERDHLRRYVEER